MKHLVIHCPRRDDTRFAHHTYFIPQCELGTFHVSGKLIEEETKVILFHYLLTLVKNFVCLRMWNLMMTLTLSGFSFLKTRIF